ncbi:MAG: sugar phosphate nucleotidyltransferase [Thermofilum sp.]
MRAGKAVLLAAGLGTRLVPFSKEIPKEMLPIPLREGDHTYPKPIIQVVYEQLYDAGVRNFCLVVGRGKRAIEDHFTPDWGFVEYLERNGKHAQAQALKKFYEKIESSFIAWVNQPIPKGTAHAVLMAKGFVGDDYFVAAAADNVFVGENVFAAALEVHERFSKPVVTAKRVDDPKRYGIVVGEPLGGPLYRVREIIEKPERPPSNLANASLYILPPEIFRAIERTTTSKRGEIELPDAIKLLIDEGFEFIAYEAQAEWIDVGSWESYTRAVMLMLK